MMNIMIISPPLCAFEKDDCTTKLHDWHWNNNNNTPVQRRQKITKQKHYPNNLYPCDETLHYVLITKRISLILIEREKKRKEKQQHKTTYQNHAL